jgi:hypothetical protein
MENLFGVILILLVTGHTIAFIFTKDTYHAFLAIIFILEQKYLITKP